MTKVASQSIAIETVLNELRSALGTAEEPDGSNDNFIVRWYNANVERIGLGPWCQMTVCWSVWVSGFKDVLAPTAWTVQAARNAQQHVNGSRWNSGITGIKPGDWVYFDWTGQHTFSKIDHVGTVEKVNSDGTIYTLEGNASNAVRRMHRDSKYIVGYVRPDWSRVVQASAPSPSDAANDTTGQIKTKIIQSLIDVPQDGIWGPQTDKAFLAWRAAKHYTKGQVQLLQKTLGNGLDQDGIWGPQTDEAVLVFRKKHLVK